MKSLLRLLLTIAFTLPCCTSLPTFAESNVSERDPDTRIDYETEIRPILAEHCFACHSQDDPDAMLRLDNLDPNFQGAAEETWHDALNRLNLDEMPPDDQPDILDSDRRKLTSWIRAGLDRAASQRTGRGVQTTLRRLTRYEYNNTLRDLLGINLDFAKDLPPDPSSADGFKNNGDSLGISPMQIEYYLEAARVALDTAIVEGPAPEVYEYRFEESGPSNDRSGTVVGNRMIPGGRFFGKLEEYPRRGEFAVRVMAGASVPNGSGIPRMRVKLGMRSDTQSPSKMLGEADVANPESEKKLYEFRARIEEFPLPGHNPKFPGITISLENVHQDGLPTPKPRKYKPIALTKEQKKEISEAVKTNTPVLPDTIVQLADASIVSKYRKCVQRLQLRFEELRLLSPDDANQTDLAYRLYDLQQSITEETILIDEIAKAINDPTIDLNNVYTSFNAVGLKVRAQTLETFRDVTPIDRTTKAFADPDPPSPPRSTLVIDYLEFEGPIYGQWPPAHHTNLLPVSDRPEREQAEQSITSLMTKAYRRPVTMSDVDPVLSVYDTIRPLSPSFEEAMRETLAMVLISPEFLYLSEPSHSAKASDTAKQPLTQHELATRISYFLWSTMPDTQLRALADAGQLNNADALEQQVRRLITDPRSQNFIDQFTSQWLDLSGLDRVAINPNYYPEFDDELKIMIKRETIAFFSEILRHDLNALNLIDSDFIMLNDPLAKHYGISERDDSPKGWEFERVQLVPQDPRGGLLTQASFLMINSNGEDSHPIRRAVWVLDRLLGDPPAPPPPDVPELDSQNPDLAKLSLKQQLELHRTKSACNDCHRGIDPWGIAFESFDAVGLQRHAVKRRIGKSSVETAVDDTAILPNGTVVNGVQELKSYLLANERERFAKSLVSKMLTYSIGRSLTLADRQQVESLVTSFQKGDYRLSDLIVAIVKSESFQLK